MDTDPNPPVGATDRPRRKSDAESPPFPSDVAEAETEKLPGKPRESWSAKSQIATPKRSAASGSQDFNVRELRPGEVGGSAGNEDQKPGVFSTLAKAVRMALRWRRLDAVTPETPQQGDSRFLNSESTSSSQREDAIALKSLEGATLTGENSQRNPFRTSRYTNPAYVPRYSDSDDQGSGDSPATATGYRAYESGIYSVNSAGNPVPITIEESGPMEEDSSSEDELDHGDTSKFRISSKKKSRMKKLSPRSLCSSIWRKSYLPQSTFLYCWLMLVTLAVLYNVWVIPLRATFYTDIQVPWSGLWLCIDVSCDVIYIIDIFIKFRTRIMKSGVYLKGTEELIHFHRREWTLVLDILSVIPTDIFFVLTINPYFRMNRVLKVYRAYNWYRTVEMRTQWPTLWRCINIVHVVLLVIHYNACIYFSLALVNGYGASLAAWAHPDPSLFPEYALVTRQYTYSFYWTLRSMFWNAVETVPESNWQFAFTIYLTLTGFALTCYVIGYVTSLVLASQSKKHEFERAMTSSRRFMKQRHLPKETQDRVEQFYHHTWLHHDFDQLDEKRMLRHLPIAIKDEMKLHGNYKALEQLPELSSCDSNLLRELVSRMFRRTYLPGQAVYKSGDAGSEMFIVGEGALQVIKELDGSVSVVKDGDVFGEMNLFNMQRNHRRTCDVISCGYSELFVLASHDVTDTLTKYPRVMNLVMQQARRNRATNAMYEGRQVSRNQGRGNVQSISNVHVSMRGSTRQQSTQGNNVGRDVSPDSAIPPSPVRSGLSEPDMGNYRAPASDAVGMIMRPDIVEKLNVVYRENLNTLKNSLDAVWNREVACLQQQLADTESERDSKAREVIQLRHRLVSAKAIPPSVREQEGAAKAKAKSKSSSTSSIKDSVSAASSKTNLKANVKAVGRARKRVLLPSVSDEAGTESADASSAVGDHNKNANSTAGRRPSAIQETPLDVYGSLASITSSTT